MNVYTVTFLNKNYGSILQAFALQSRLREFGVVPCILINGTKKHSKLYKLLYNLLKLFLPKENYNFAQKFWLLLDKRKYSKKNAKIDTFVSKNISTRIIKDINQFVEEEVKENDIFIAGSDQIWNKSNPMSPWFSLKWVKGRCKKFSYAASIGRYTLTKEQISSFADSLSEFNFISVRERQSLESLSNVFYDRIRQDLDPTLLYNGAFWKEMASPRLINGPYLFVYRLRPNDDVFFMARKIAKKRGLKIVYTGLIDSHCEDICTIYNAGVEDFLSLVLYADAVSTNSFHGTVFSIQFEKPFLSIGLASTGARAESFLGMLELKSQLVTDVNKDYTFDIDYLKVNNILERERKRSLEYIDNICNKRI